MCGVLGFFSDRYLGKSEFLSLFNEASMRGKHSTKYLDLDTLLIKDHTEYTGSKNFIGHCRYSTSDLSYPQPLHIGGGYLVHNGVITQESPEKWANKPYVTKNDSEILLKYLDSHRSYFNIPLLSNYPCCSYAFIYYDPDLEEIIFSRNGKRPLHYAHIDGGLVIASTKSIIDRSFYNPYTVKEVGAGEVYSFNVNFRVITLIKTSASEIDLQHREL